MNLGSSQVDVWLARDAQWQDPELLAGLPEILSEDERARVARMALPEGKHQQLVTRALTRQVLSHYLPEVPPAAWRFTRSEHGRPSVSAEMRGDARALHFSLAHTAGLVVMAVARVPEIGVDVERAGGRAPLAVARRYFSADEIDELESLPEAEQPRRFQRLWTLKEAYLKAIGTGVSGGLSSMAFHIEGNAVRFERAGEPGASRWVFREFNLGEEFLLALAVLAGEGATPEVTLRDYPPRASGQEQRAETQ